MSLLEETVVDVVTAMAEKGVVLPPHIPVRYTEAEWAAVERFHRLRITHGEPHTLDDRYPFVTIKTLGITVRLYPDNPKPTKETVH